MLESWLVKCELPPGGLPYLTAELPGIGGQIKQEPAHFVVEEVPLYAASGEGAHLYVCLTREGMTTKQVQERLAEIFGLRADDIGYAGLKDRHARTTQVFSLPDLHESDVVRIEQEADFTVQWARRHRNKLKPGHLLGNRFQILVSGHHLDGLTRAKAIAHVIRQQGVPNYFGAQRFGSEGDNAQRGREVLLHKSAQDRWLRKFLISAYQSYLFNVYLAERIQRGWFSQLLPGDVAKKHDTGGLFVVEDVAQEQPRFVAQEISYTGPLYGRKMRAAEHAAGEFEAEILHASGLAPQAFRKARVDGNRRFGRLLVQDLEIKESSAGLLFSFYLPKGGYATTVLREFMKDAI